jgi:hypothetical protein
MAARIWKKLLLQYLVATGVLAHAALIGMFLLAPDLAHKATDKARQIAGAKMAAVLPEPAADTDWETARASLRRWTPQDGASVGPGRVRLDGDVVGTLAEALERLRDESLLEIGAGIYRTPLVVRPNGVRIVGHGHVIFDGAVAEGKGTFVIKGRDTTIENIECRNVQVRDGNGACVRLAGPNLVLDRMYFHSSQEGLLTGGKPGDVVIRRSFFERLGHGGRAHGIYQGGGTLTIDRSYVLGAQDQGHEVKSRAKRTTISNSVIASLTGRDSRLIDLPNGGSVSITDSTLQQGPNSVNRDMVGFALEKRPYENSALEMKRNLIILERNGANKLLSNNDRAMRSDISDNIIVAPQRTEYASDNLEYRDREQAGLPPYPIVPDRPA